MPKAPVLAFVHIPKTGGSTVKYLLRNSFGVRHCDVKSARPEGRFDAAELKWAQRVYPLALRSISGHALIGSTELLPEHVKLFTFLRHPLNRLASKYQHHYRGNRRKRLGQPLLPLEAFLEEGKGAAGLNGQVWQIAGKYDLEAAKQALTNRYFFVGLTERFRESIQMLADLSPYPIDLQYVTKNQAPESSVKDAIMNDPKTRTLIEERNELDLQLYEYARDVLWPAQQERAREQTAELLERAAWVGRMRATLSRGYNTVFYRFLVLKGLGLANRKVAPAP